MTSGPGGGSDVGWWDPAAIYIAARGWLLRGMGAWLLPMFGSSLSFAFADVLCDVVILEKPVDGEEEEDGEEEGEGEEDGDDRGGSDRADDDDASGARADADARIGRCAGGSERSPMLAAGARSDARARSDSRGSSSAPTSPHAKMLKLAHEAEGLTGEQDTAMAGSRRAAAAATVRAAAAPCAAAVPHAAAAHARAHTLKRRARGRRAAQASPT